MEEDKKHELGQTPIRKLAMRYFWPALIGTMANTLYNIVDRIFIGRVVGAEALGGLTAVFPVMTVMTAFGMLIGLGSGVQLSIALGKGNMRLAKMVLGNAVVMVTLISATIMLLGFALKQPMLEMFGASDSTLAYASDYLDIILWGVVFHEFGFSINALIRSEGNARVAMMSMLISAGINIPLDALFIMGFGWGVKGAAWATIISMLVLCLWVLAHFRGSKCVVRLEGRYIKVWRAVLGPVLAVGISPFLQQAAHSVVQALFNFNLIRQGGDLAVSAMGIINSVIVVAITFITSLNMALQPIIGFNLGAGNYTRVKSSLKFGIVVSTAICVVMWAAVQLFPAATVRVFNADTPKLVEIGVHGLRLMTLMLPVVGFQIIAGNYFQSVNKAKMSIFLSMLRQVIILIPILLILPPIYGVDGVWFSMPIADTISACVTAYFLMREWRYLRGYESGIIQISKQ
ncbi:MAG: MATE family efflux transporter [Bacteroidales bacterium]|nr:MATE family efflux transporter [Bacteroidales bacterium]